MNQYLKVKILDRNEDPIVWWSEHEAAYPSLHKLAMKYLSIPGTSVPAERLFSKAGELISARRNRLKPKHVNMVLFLNKYL
uniref:HAT C-terminal dimerisation domain-containing protein n=1 Tax=Amphimedon queenslandica TaxID=400682 RepID=A0A1X7TCX8_AMPQE